MKVVTKDANLVIRLDPRLKKALAKEAAALGVRLSEYARRLLSGEAQRPRQIS